MKHGNTEFPPEVRLGTFLLFCYADRTLRRPLYAAACRVENIRIFTKLHADGSLAMMA
jgi:hypothetical protein